MFTAGVRPRSHHVEAIAKSRPDKNWTNEQVKKLIDVGAFTAPQAKEHGLPVVRVTVWETPTSFADYRAAE